MSQTVRLFEYQEDAVKKLKSGSILCGGVGSGKSITALAYYYQVCWGIILENEAVKIPMMNPKDLYIITTARKRDTLEWEKECNVFNLSKDRATSISNVLYIVDSWNNISNYENVENAFFIFDEQRLVGSGAWVKSFLKISKKNHWILLSATPGDAWVDYIPVFVANGFYKNRTEFLRLHVVFNQYVSYPKISYYTNVDRLHELKKRVLVHMNYLKKTEHVKRLVLVEYDKEKYEFVAKQRWNIFENAPIKNAAELCYVWRKIVNSDQSRPRAIAELFEEKKKLIVFYNFNYELDILKLLGDELKIPTAEWNGHRHQPIPNTKQWMYLVQYTSGAEGWNCIDTDAIVFYSQNYSYKMMHQAAGRIDRLNTPFKNLYYYHLVSNSPIDNAIIGTLRDKKDFNEKDFAKF